MCQSTPTDAPRWVNDMYLEIKAQWNRRRALNDATAEELRFLIHLMEVIESNDP